MLELIKKELASLSEIKDIYQVLLSNKRNYTHMFFIRIDNRNMKLTVNNEEYQLLMDTIIIDDVEMQQFVIKIYNKDKKNEILKKCLQHIKCALNPAKAIIEEIND